MCSRFSIAASRDFIPSGETKITSSSSGGVEEGSGVLKGHFFALMVLYFFLGAKVEGGGACVNPTFGGLFGWGLKTPLLGGWVVLGFSLSLRCSINHF